MAMIDYYVFWILTISITLCGVAFGLAFGGGMFGWGGKIVLAILFGLLALSIGVNATDGAVMTSTATSHNASNTIVDSYDGGYYLLLWHDLSIKLENGKILKFNDPYKWKQFKVGSQYNYTEYSAFSYIQGNVTYTDYDYIGVI
jgi:hypothetical protein